MTCACIARINGTMEEHRVQATMPLFGGPSAALIGLIRRDKWTLESRRGKPSFIAATFCPFCGTKYDDPTPGKRTGTEPIRHPVSEAPADAPAGVSEQAPLHSDPSFRVPAMPAVGDTPIIKLTALRNLPLYVGNQPIQRCTGA